MDIQKYELHRFLQWLLQMVERQMEARPDTRGNRKNQPLFYRGLIFGSRHISAQNYYYFTIL